MRKTDITLGSILIGICLFLFFMIFNLPDKARIYPMFVTSLLLFLTIIHMIITIKKEKDEERSPFNGIQKRQLLFVVITSGAYVAFISILGYVTSTILYVLTVLIGLNISKKMSIVVTIGFAAFIYTLFKIILKVPLPTGFLI